MIEALRGDPAATTCPSMSTTLLDRIGDAVAGRSASTPAAATTTGCGSPRRCAALAAGIAHRAACWTRACIRATRRGSCRTVLPHHARPADTRIEDCRDRRDDAGRSCAVPRSRRSASRRPRKPQRVAGRTGLSQVPLRRHDASRCVEDLGQLVLNRTWRPQLATVGMAPSYSASRSMPATCCCPTPSLKLSVRTAADARRGGSRRRR
jgi:hypothetical protein